jgi:hypothetical protein
MDDNTGYQAFCLYQSIKLHFTSSSYCYFKYNGKTNISKQSFLNNKSKYQFYKLSRKYDLEELKNFYVANFLVGNGVWVGDMITSEGNDNFTKWKKRIESLTYIFENDTIGLFESSGNCLHVDNGNYPVLLREVMQGVVSLETLCIMDDIMNFLPMWSKKIKDDIIWPDWEMKILKYKPFLNYDKVKFKAILKEKIKEYAQN